MKNKVVKVRGDENRKKILKKITKPSKEDIADQTEDLIGTFKHSYQELKKLVGSTNADFQSDVASVALYRAMLSTLVDSIGIAEEQYKKYQYDKQAYALSALINQAREVSNDIRSFENLEQKVGYIMEKIVQPSIMLVINKYIGDCEQLKESFRNSKLETSIRNSTCANIDITMRSHATFLKEVVESIRSKLEKYLLEQ